MYIMYNCNCACHKTNTWTLAKILNVFKQSVANLLFAVFSYLFIFDIINLEIDN